MTAILSRRSQTWIYIALSYVLDILDRLFGSTTSFLSQCNLNDLAMFAALGMLFYVAVKIPC